MKTYVASYIEVQPAYTEQALPLLADYRTRSAVEEGAAHIEILQEVHRPNRFVVIEEWTGDSSLQLHNAAQSTTDFRDRLRQLHKSPDDRRVHLGFAIGPEPESYDSSSLFVVTHVDVPPPRKDETEILLTEVAEKMRTSPGNLRFDVFQQTAPRLNHFTLVAAWKNQGAFAAHEASDVSLQFREALGPMLGALYDERIYRLTR